MKYLRIGAVITLGLFLLAVWSGVVRHVALGGSGLRSFTEPVKFFSQLPVLMQRGVHQLVNPPERFIKTPEDFKAINRLTYDLYGVNSVFEQGVFRIFVENYRDSSIYHEWTISKDLLNQYYEGVDNTDRLYQPVILPGNEVIVSLAEKFLLKLDAEGRVVWTNDEYATHHAINLDHEGNVWSPGVASRNRKVIPRYVDIADGPSSLQYRDDLILKFDSSTGKVIFSRSLADLFADHKMDYMINNTLSFEDPFHLNDIEPITENTEFFKRGDVLLSLRNLSAIVQYRPATDEIVRIVEGPFSYQHDVDVVGTDKILISNNNTTGLYLRIQDQLFSKEKNEALSRRVINHSNVLLYDLRTDQFQPLYEKQFIKHGIFTDTEGLAELLDNGDLFYEETTSGILWVVNENQIILKKVIPTVAYPGYHHLPSWTRIYSNSPLLNL